MMKQRTSSSKPVMDRLRRWWKRYTTPYVDIRDDKLSQLPRLSPVWDETTATRAEMSSSDSANYSQDDDSFTMFDTNSIHSPSPSRRKGKSHDISDTNSLIGAVSKQRDIEHHQDPPAQYEIDFDYYERQSITCGSLESIDSLAESYWDLDEETTQVSASQDTPPVVNIRSKMHQEFFAEHIRFLRIQTKPQKVEIIWGPESNKKSRP